MDNQNPQSQPTPAAPISSTPPAAASAPVTPTGAPYQPPVTSPPPTPASPIVPPTPPTKKGMPLLLVLVILLLIVGSGVGVYVWSMQSSKPQVKKLSMPTMQPSPTIIPTDIPMASPAAMSSDSADWKTYTSTYDYSFAYPPSRTLEEANTKDFGNVLTGQYLINQGSNLSTDKDKIAVMLTNWTFDHQKSFLNYGEAGNQAKATITTEQYMGKTIIKAVITTSQLNYKTNNYEESPIKSYVVLIPMENNTLRIEGNLSQQEVINQMLSTFEFTK